MTPGKKNDPVDTITPATDLRMSLLHTGEGRILISGMGLTLVFIATAAAAAWWYPQAAQMVVGMTATHILFGRIAGMTFGYTLGMGHDIVVPVNLAIETLLVMLFYPVFVLSWQRLLDIPRLYDLLGKTRRAAKRHQGTIRRYGPAGLFVFVWFPFWMTGPLVGCIIGFLIGLRPVINLGIVLGGTYMAIFTYALMLKELNDQVAAIGPYAPLVLLGLVILVFGIVHLVSVRNGNKTR